MLRKILAALTACALAAATFAPTPALARDRGYHRYDHYDRHHYRHRRHHDGDAALAAGVVGLVVGLALGAAASQPPPPPRYQDSYGYGPPPPPPRYEDSDGYYRDSYAPAPGYPPPPPGYGEACIRQVEQWDPHSGRYVWVNLRTPC